MTDMGNLAGVFTRVMVLFYRMERRSQVLISPRINRACILLAKRSPLHRHRPSQHRIPI
ncbi:hypothetical protein [Phormidium sp. CCY1219]|uniref:hypothetical protein n=1 Tax=Phormidium sp. CCY1219 TaxID=2886104 RepID=UPI002D1E94A5|nr:hypothetical protein [Phormidium sp. CCY1219]MEB3829146.1 hypothetical protein [Phormidium sp. CCY1219]